MHHQHLLRALSRTAIAGVAVTMIGAGLAACGSSSSGSTGGTIFLATDLPVSGTDAGVGLPTQYGADLAVSQNSDLGHGYKLSIVHKNDEGTNGPDGSVGAANIQSLVSNAQVMAVVGPFNSGVAKLEIPVVNSAGLVLISPTNTNPGLTKEQYAAANGINFQQLHPSGKPEAYFRIPATDDVQGKVDAMIASQQLNAKTAYVIDDKTTYGKGLATFFTNNFKSDGGTIVGSQEIDANQTSNFPSVATDIISKHPDVVFFGGVTSGGGGALKADLVSAGSNIPMVGGDGIADDPAWLKTAGNGAVNTYGTVAAPEVTALTGSAASKFKSDYTTFVAGKTDNDLLPYSAQAYDAAMIEITAIKDIINSGGSVTRSAVRDQVAKINYSGLTGQISFDSNGDNSGQKVFSIYFVDNSGKWAYKGQAQG